MTHLPVSPREETALVLGGGGILGAAFEIGALAAMEARWGRGLVSRRFNGKYDPYVSKGADFELYGPALKEVPRGSLAGPARGPKVSVAGKLDTRRYLCVFCHAPQTKSPPLVEDRFKP